MFLLQTYVQNTGAYLSDIVNKTFNLYAYEPTDWIGGWTLLYWGWWLSWSPFVGLFIARISRGRTIREFVCGVLFVPAGFTLLWMTVFGDTAIHMVLQEGFTQLAEVVNQDSSVALFAFLEHFPLGSVISLVAVLMVVVFFVTSADSGALVVDMLASSGRPLAALAADILVGADGRGGHRPASPMASRRCKPRPSPARCHSPSCSWRRSGACSARCTWMPPSAASATRR